MRDLEKQDQNDGSIWVQCGQICRITDIEDVKGEKDVVARKALMKKIFWVVSVETRYSRRRLLSSFGSFEKRRPRRRCLNRHVGSY